MFFFFFCKQNKLIENHLGTFFVFALQKHIHICKLGTRWSRISRNNPFNLSFFLNYAFPTSGKAVVEEGEDDEDGVESLQGNQQVIEGVGGLPSAIQKDNFLSENPHFVS